MNVQPWGPAHVRRKGFLHLPNEGPWWLGWWGLGWTLQLSMGHNPECLSVIQILRYISWSVSIQDQQQFFPNAHGWVFLSVHLLSEKKSCEESDEPGGIAPPTTDILRISMNPWRYDHPENYWGILIEIGIVPSHLGIGINCWGIVGWETIPIPSWRHVHIMSPCCNLTRPWPAKSSSIYVATSVLQLWEWCLGRILGRRTMTDRRWFS